MKTLDEKEKSELLRTVFDALPSLVFVVDEDVGIQEFNAAASDLLMAERKTVLKHRAGEILHCIHSSEAPGGCGRSSSCQDCLIRNSVAEAFRGNRVVRRRARIELIQDSKKVEMYALITVSPFFFEDRPLVLLVIEDISEIAEISRLISICSICKKVCDDQESWMRVEAYFNNNWGVDFSHGLCPDCYQIEMHKLKSLIKAKQNTP